MDPRTTRLKPQGLGAETNSDWASESSLTRPNSFKNPFWTLTFQSLPLLSLSLSLALSLSLSPSSPFEPYHGQSSQGSSPSNHHHHDSMVVRFQVSHSLCKTPPILSICCLSMCYQIGPKFVTWEYSRTQFKSFLINPPFIL